MNFFLNRVIPGEVPRVESYEDGPIRSAVSRGRRR